MRPILCIATFCIVAAQSLATNAADWLTEQQAQTLAANWLQQRDGKIKLDYRADTKALGFQGTKIAGSPDTMYVLNSSGWQVTLGFQGVVDPQDTADSLNRRLKYIALDKIPMPGLTVKGWEIKPLTPVSSFKDGVAIQSFTNGVAQVTVKSKAFCLSGRVQPDLLGPQPADAGLPAGTYFQLRQDIPLELTFAAPLGMAK